MNKNSLLAWILAATTGLAFLAGPASANLQLDAVAAPDPAAAGSSIELFIAVSNNGGSALTGVEVSMVVPASLDAFNERIAAVDPASCNTIGSTATCQTGETMTWTIGTLDPGEGRTLIVPPTITAGTPDGTTISFDPGATEDLLTTATANATVTVDSAAAFELALDADRSPVPSGDTLAYTLTFGHVAEARAAPGTVLELGLPGGTTYVSASHGGVHAAGTVTWTLGTLDPSQGGQVTATVTTGAGLSDGELLTATALIADTDGEEARAGTITRVRDAAPLALAIDVNPDPVIPGQTQNVLLTVTNPGLFNRNDVVVTALIPRRVTTFAEGLGEPNSLSCNTIGSTATCQTAESMQWTLGTLAAGTGVTVAMPPDIDAATATAAVVSFRAWARSADGAEAGAGGSSEVRAAAAFELALDASGSPVAPGTELTYTISYGHVATAAVASGTALTLPLPAGTTFVSASDGGTLSGDTITWSLGTLGPSEGGQVSATVAVGGGLANGTLLQTEAAIADTGSPVRSAHASNSARVSDSATLQLALELNPDPVRPDQTHDVWLTATNTGPFDLNGVRITLLIPAENAVYNESIGQPTSASCNTLGSTATCQPRERVFWDIGSLPAGSGKTVAVPPRIDVSTPDAGLANYEAWVSDDTGAQFRISDTAIVRDEPAFELALDERSDPVAPGSDVTYFLTWGHVADARVAPGTVLRLDIPDGATFAAASDGGTLSAGGVEWNLGTLSPSVGGQVHATVTFDSGLDEGALVEAQASVSDTASPPEIARAETVTRIATDWPVQVMLEASPDPVQPGQTQAVRVILSTANPFGLTAASITGMIPDEVDEFGETLGTIISNSCNTIGSTATCRSGERYFSANADVAPGTSRMFTIPPLVSAVPDGDVITYRAWATDDEGRQAISQQSVVVDSLPAFDVDIALDQTPAVVNDNATYTLTVGQLEQDAGDASLTFTLPAGTSFVSATGGGALSGDAVEWTIAGIEKGEGAYRSVTVDVDGAQSGDLLGARADISKPSLDSHARAFLATAASNPSPLSLAMNATPNPAVPGTTPDISLTVTNDSAAPVSDVLLTIQVPESIDEFSESLLSGINSNSCNQLGSTATCQSRDLVFWSIGSLGAGASATVALPPTITDDAAAPANGTVIRTLGFATATGLGISGATTDLLVSDLDGLGDPFDNCLWVANPAQQDTDADNIGNACDADIAPMPNDCVVNFLDLSAIKLAFLSNPAQPAWNPDADFNSDNLVNFLDLQLIKRTFLSAPGPSGLPSVCD